MFASAVLLIGVDRCPQVTKLVHALAEGSHVAASLSHEPHWGPLSLCVSREESNKWGGVTGAWKMIGCIGAEQACCNTTPRDLTIALQLARRVHMQLPQLPIAEECPTQCKWAYPRRERRAAEAGPLLQRGRQLPCGCAA